MSEDEREKLEAIDSRVVHIMMQFTQVTSLLTTLFERQIDLEDLINRQAKLLVECHETIESEYGNGPVILDEIAEIQRETEVLLERSVK